MENIGLETKMSQSLYEDYTSVPVSTRTRDGPAGYGFLTTTEDYYVQVLAQNLNDTTDQLGTMHSTKLVLC